GVAVRGHAMVVGWVLGRKVATVRTSRFGSRTTGLRTLRSSRGSRAGRKERLRLREGSARRFMGGLHVQGVLARHPRGVARRQESAGPAALLRHNRDKRSRLGKMSQTLTKAA